MSSQTPTTLSGGWLDVWTTTSSNAGESDETLRVSTETMTNRMGGYSAWVANAILDELRPTNVSRTFLTVGGGVHRVMQRSWSLSMPIASVRHAGTWTRVVVGDR